MQRIIIISNRLPVSLDFSGSKITSKQGIGGLATGMKPVHENHESLWFGWPMYNPKELSTEKLIEAEQILAENKCAPVYLEQEDIDNYYFGFSNRTIWPLFHYFMQYTEYRSEFWESYVRVNEIFAETIAKHIKKDDMIWIHDYHLFLLPKLLRDKFPDIGIGFFLHIPFPSYEVFRMLPWRNEIIEGIIGSDLVGFHTYDYERHFRSCVHRLLGYDSDFNTIHLNTRDVRIDVFPMGIDFDYFENSAIKKLNQSESKKTNIQKEIDKYRIVSPERKLILSIDRLDYSKGIPNRLWAFERFLEKYPEHRGKATLMMLATPTRSNVPQYKIMKREVDELVGHINGKYGMINWTPVWYFYRSMPMENLIDLYLSSDVALLTPIRDGMNLVAKEYITAKPDNTGVLILSEMAGSAQEMSEALIINPNNTEEIADAINQALAMPKKEQKIRNSILKERLKRYDITKWANDFISTLKQQAVREEIYKPKSLKSTIGEIFRDYKNSSKRVIFLDYDGTLVTFKNDPQMASPDENLYKLLEDIKSDPKNDLIIVSGRDKETLDKWFGDTNIKMVAEHGVWIYTNEEWVISEQMNDVWKDTFRPIVQRYVDRTPGSFFEEKNYSLVWHYRKADPELGKNRSIELKDEVTSMIANHNLEIMEGNKVVEIKASGINKGKAVQNCLSGYDYDFILAIGDDWTDEYMFQSLPTDAYTIKVGNINTHARIIINSVSEVRDFLKSLTNLQ